MSPEWNGITESSGCINLAEAFAAIVALILKIVGVDPAVRHADGLR
jgi:hypothetical protein